MAQAAASMARSQGQVNQAAQYEAWAKAYRQSLPAAASATWRRPTAKFHDRAGKTEPSAEPSRVAQDATAACRGPRHDRMWRWARAAVVAIGLTYRDSLGPLYLR